MSTPNQPTYLFTSTLAASALCYRLQVATLMQTLPPGCKVARSVASRIAERIAALDADPIPSMELSESTLATVVPLAQRWADSENNEAEEAVALFHIHNHLSEYRMTKSVVKGALIDYRIWYLAEKAH